MALIPSVKQGQVQAGINKARAQAVKVHCSEAIAANDILVVTGIHSPSNVLSVAKADANDITKCRGPFYVADYAAASGDITPVALPWKLITGVNTSGSHVGKAVYLADTAGNVILTQPAVVVDNDPFRFQIQVGRVVSVDASDGAYVLQPSQASPGAPLVARVETGNNTSTARMQGLANLNGFPVLATTIEDDGNGEVQSAAISGGTLTVTLTGNATGVKEVAVMIWA